MPRSTASRHSNSPDDPRAGVGFALVVTAMIVGAVLVVVISDQGQVTTPGAVSVSTRPGSAGASTTLAQDAVPGQGIRVLVLNASGVSQAAATVANDLRGLGYSIAGTGNAEEQAGTTIACRADVADAAAALATTTESGKVVEFPAKLPEGGADADCIITLGT